MIDSLDAKITQYLYAISKLQHMIKSLRRIQAREIKKDLPLLQYIILYGGSTFAIADSVLSPKLESLSNFQSYRQVPISISTIVNHIPYDAPDLPVTSLSELPDIQSADKCLRLFEGICITSLQGYQKKLLQAKSEKMAYMNNNTESSSSSSSSNCTSINEHIAQIEKIIEKILSPTKDADCSLANDQFLLNLPSNVNLLHNEDFIEATLVDMDIRMLLKTTSSIQTSLNALQKQIKIYLSLKSFKGDTPTSKAQWHQIQATTDVPLEYSLHHVLLLTLRLNELYTIFRRVGRKCYFSNSEHMMDQKLYMQSKNPTLYKNGLRNCDEYFNSSKKNGTLIATLTRFFRQGAAFEANPKTVNDLVNFINQGFIMLTQIVGSSDEFARLWLSTELRFRKNYGLPKKILTDLHTELNSVSSTTPTDCNIGSTPVPANASKTETPASVELSPTKLNQSSSEISIDSSLSKLIQDGFNDASEKEKQLISETEKLDIASPSVDSSRTSSISSNNSRMGKTSCKFVTPTASPAKINSTSSPSRPQSMMFMHQNSSLSAISPPPKENMAASTGRRRSNSQPIRLSSDASAGAASALIKNYAVSPNSKSPISSLRRQSSISKKKPLVSVQEEQKKDSSKENSPEKDNSNPVSPQLTANQRYQLHLKNASKQGTLVTQQKEIMSSVVYDPNDPKSVNLRPKRSTTELKASNGLPSTTSSLPPGGISGDFSNLGNGLSRSGLGLGSSPSNSASPIPNSAGPSNNNTNVKPTRAQVTRMNTKRNSISLNPTEIKKLNANLNAQDSTSTSSDSTTSEANETIKKVRFTGVPEWTEAEDAPVKYADKILKNFAVFRTPNPAKKKDQLFKKEESLSFKSQLQNGTGDTTSLNNSFTLPKSTPLNVSPLNNRSRLGKLKKIL